MAEQVSVTKVIEVDVKASAQAAEHLKSLADKMTPIKDAADKASNSLGSMLSTLRGFVGFQIMDMVGSTVMKVASALQEASDKAKVLEERMKLVTGSSADAQLAFQTIVDISVRQGRELDAVAKLYEKVQRSSEQLAISQKGVAMITEGVAASLRLSGASTQEANAAMLQFAQALASGKLGGDEFRSLMENNSVLMQEFAKQLGTTMGGLREMSKEGKLNAEVLRNAMLKVGEDGKTMMQRMIEQAEKLPKTFAQAITGVKTSLVDLVDALQQTGTKAEGVFVRIIRRLGEAMREAAMKIREEAMIQQAQNEEIAKLYGRFEDEPEQTAEQKQVNRLVERRKLANEALERANQALAIGRQANAANVNWEKSLGFRTLSENVAKAKGELRSLQDQLETITRINASEANPVKGLITGNVKTTPGDDDKKKKGPDTAVDVIERIRSDLENKAAVLQGLIAGETKAYSELDAKLAEIDKVPAGKLSATFIEAEKASLRRLAAFNDELQREADYRTESDKRLTDRNKEVEKEYDHHMKELQKIRDQANKDRLTQDPFIGAEAEVERLKKLAWDERTSDEMAQIIFDRITQVRAKAAKQLLGGKDPLKSVGDQMADAFERSFNRMEEDLLDFNKSVKDIFKDMVTSILKEWARLEIKQHMSPLIAAGKAWVTDLFGGSSYGTTPTGLQLLENALGNVFGPSGLVKKFAIGGVVDSPTPFAYGGGIGVAGEAGPEAIMPLERGSDGKLGVGVVPVEVNIYNTAKNTSTRTEESQGPGGQRQINVIIEETVEASIGAGRFDKVLNSSYSITRKGK